jgi:hypothetical protein
MVECDKTRLSSLVKVLYNYVLALLLPLVERRTSRLLEVEVPLARLLEMHPTLMLRQQRMPLGLGYSHS